MRLAAVGDLHIKKTSQGQLQPLLASVNEHADVLLLCGDLTDYGLEEEAAILARELRAVVRIPMVAVLGNHDYESGHPDKVREVLTEAGVQILDGEAVEVKVENGRPRLVIPRPIHDPMATVVVVEMEGDRVER